MAIVKIRDFDDNEEFYKEYIFDVKRIKKVLLENGYDSSLRSAYELWQEHSDTYCAGWLFLPKTDLELWILLQDQVKKIAG